MLLSELLSQAGVTPDRVSGDAEISGMVMDSRKARAGSLFTAMPSKNSDSHSFIPAAKEKGATAVLAHSEAGFEGAISAGLAAVLVKDEGLNFNEAVWRLAKVAFGNPSASMKVIGVTGTNGKTTTAWLIRDMLCALGVKAGYLGTLGFQIPGEERELSNTTPFSIELNELLAEARDKGVEAMAIEVSSHALAERRVDGIEFDAAVFTNLTQDHLDFHGSMEAYEAAKLRLFTELPKQSQKQFVAAFNVDDSVGEIWSADYKGPQIAYGRGLDPRTYDLEGWPIHQGRRCAIEGCQRLIGQVCGLDVDWLSLDLFAPGMAHDESHVHLRLGGDYNVENALSATAGFMALGFTFDGVSFALPKVRPVPGRFEAVPNDAGIGILVDYAHTPDALEKLLDAVRNILNSKLETRNSKIITVFGCGGDRDRNKRPKMAKAASERSDITVVTSDNPRTEDPDAILKDVVAGIEGEVTFLDAARSGGGVSPPNDGPAPIGQHARATGRRAFAIIDRREAIAHAIKIAEPGDVVVIAGKGHENYQIIGRTKYPMDDRELAREGLTKRSPLPTGGEG